MFLTRYCSCLITLSFFLITQTNIAVSQPYTPVEDGPIHEAFMTKVVEPHGILAIQETPPRPITEQIPKQPGPDLEWIQGYWYWDSAKKDFIWIAGVWRRPPPGHQWIRGYWHNFHDGWMWIPGFWSAQEEGDLNYIDRAPPDLLDEDVSDPQSDDYFWFPGHWYYNSWRDRFDWVKGEWLEWDPHFVLVPAHYMWRPEGYVFVPAFWDWALDDRGKAFASLYIEPSARIGFSYRPYIVVDAPLIISHQIIFYPDYLCHFWHHFHFHPHFWAALPFVPPWWSWNQWWCFTWHDHWALWWWWAHPGFPHPFWMNVHMAHWIFPPHFSVLNLFANIPFPLFISSNGLILPHLLLNAIAQISGNNLPIIPFQGDVLNDILDIATKDLKPPKEILEPMGTPGDDADHKKPVTDDSWMKDPDFSVLDPEVPNKPDIRERAPEIEKRPIITPPPPPIRRHYVPRPPVYHRPEPPPRRPPPPKRPWPFPSKPEYRPAPPTKPPPQRYPIPPTRRPPPFRPPPRQTPPPSIHESSPEIQYTPEIRQPMIEFRRTPKLRQNKSEMQPRTSSTSQKHRYIFK